MESGNGLLGKEVQGEMLGASLAEAISGDSWD